MNTDVSSTISALPRGVMLNAYPDSIGHSLADTIDMLKRPEFKDVFALLYVLPTFFHSDLDRGFSIIDYDRNEELVSEDDLKDLDALHINLKFDLVLNHLSVGSPQFQDMLEHGDSSRFKDFFVDWNEFWSGHGTMGDDGYIIPNEEHLRKLFMRKPGLPILKVRFPDGSDRPYWNTFYQDVTYQELTASDVTGLHGLSPEDATAIVGTVNDTIAVKGDLGSINLGAHSSYRDDVLSIVERKRRYLGQMDLNARSEGVWAFYDATLKNLHDFGAKLVRLDAFAYLHKEPGMTNFFNKPGTWDYLERLRQIATKYDLTLLPEIHAEYGTSLHAEVADKGFPVYDFFLPGLVIDALDRGTTSALLRWTNEVLDKGIQTINMLGCHDGIPVLDLKGKEMLGVVKSGLLTDEQIDTVMENVIARGGRVKNLYGPDGTKISYYQVNATFFSALGESEQKLRLARAIQLFMPGIPQVWYLDLFAGTNNYEAADGGGAAGHKEINRTTLSTNDVEAGLSRSVVQDQLTLMRLRNTSPAFNGELEIGEREEHLLQLTWRQGSCSATLAADLKSHAFTVTETEGTGNTSTLSFG